MSKLTGTDRQAGRQADRRTDGQTNLCIGRLRLQKKTDINLRNLYISKNFMRFPDTQGKIVISY